jgi:hypothetical protein
MSRLRGSLLILAVVCAAVTAHGQAVTANLQGVVSDASGAVVAGARVTATNLDTGEKRSVESNAEGFYRFNLLPRGPYEVRTQKMGFADQSLKLTLTVGDTVTANFALKVAGQTQQVEVTSLASQVDTSSSQIEQPISQVQIADLPINDRNF